MSDFPFPAAARLRVREVEALLRRCGCSQRVILDRKEAFLEWSIDPRDSQWAIMVDASRIDFLLREADLDTLKAANEHLNDFCASVIRWTARRAA